MKNPKHVKYGIGALILDCLFTIEAIANICSGKGKTLDYVMLFLFVFIAMLLVYERIAKK